MLDHFAPQEADAMPEMTERLIRLEIGQDNHQADLKGMSEELKGFIAESREDRHARRNQSMITDRRLEKLESVINGDPSRNKPGLDTRVENIESVIVSSKVAWKIAVAIGGTIIAIAGALSGFWQSIISKPTH